MSYYDDSSLFVAPNGYKASVLFAQKPMDANGQLAFTRSNDTATRVASNGLIERVRTNQIRNSSMVGASAPFTLPTNWVLIGGGLSWTVVGVGTENGLSYIEINATGTASSSNARIGFDSSTQILGATSQYWTNSFYFKKVSETAAPDSYAMAIFENTSAGSLVVANVGSLPATTSLARYSYTVLTSGGATVARVQPFVRFSLTLGNSYNFTFRIAATQMEQGDIATQFIPTTTAAVSVGPVASVPRLDYLNSSCPRLILEPQRTNVITFSEQMGNAAWTKTNATITENQTTSPSGYVDADKLIPSSGQQGILQQNHLITATQANTMSIFAKAGELNIITLANRDNASASNAAIVEFDLSTGVISTAASASGVYSAASGTITNYGNGWYRLTLTFTSSASVTNRVRLFTDTSGDGTKGLFVWGAQFETNSSYASSYVPTLAASVTRGADACSKTGISSLIGQTEGTLFVDLNYETVSGLSMFLSIRPNSTNKIEVYRDGQTIYGDILGNSVSVLLSKSANPASRYKIALAYKSGQTSLYINGTSVGTSATAFSFATSMADLFINLRSGPTFVEQAFYNQVLLFTTRLPNSELASLTTL